MSFPFLPGPLPPPPRRKTNPITQVRGPPSSPAARGERRSPPPAWQAAPPAPPRPALHPRAKSCRSRPENFPAGRGWPRLLPPRPARPPPPPPPPRKRGTAKGAAAGLRPPRACSAARTGLGGRAAAPGCTFAQHLPRRRLWQQGRAGGRTVPGAGPARSGRRRGCGSRRGFWPPICRLRKALADGTPPPAAAAAAAPFSRSGADVRAPAAASSGAASSAPGLSPLSGRGPGPSLRHLPRSFRHCASHARPPPPSQSHPALLNRRRRRRCACAPLPPALPARRLPGAVVRNPARAWGERGPPLPAPGPAKPQGAAGRARAALGPVA